MTILYVGSILIVLGIGISRSWQLYAERKRKKKAEIEAELDRLREWRKTAKPGDLFACNHIQIFRKALALEHGFVLGVDKSPEEWEFKK